MVFQQTLFNLAPGLSQIVLLAAGRITIPSTGTRVPEARILCYPFVEHRLCLVILRLSLCLYSVTRALPDIHYSVPRHLLSNRWLLPGENAMLPELYGGEFKTPGRACVCEVKAQQSI